MTKLKLGRVWAVLLGLVLAAVCFVIAVNIVDRSDIYNSDFFSFWLAGHMVFTGQDPYSPALWVPNHHLFGATWISDPTFLYPIPLSFLFAPLGALPLYLAYLVWIWLLQLFVILAFVLLLKSIPSAIPKWYYFPLTAGFLLFRPTILIVPSGQLGGFLLLVLAGVVYLWEKEKYGQGALLLPVLAVKPNLGVPILFFITIYLLLRKKFVPFLAECAAGIAFISIGFLQNPDWMREYWQSGNLKLSQTFGFSPTVWGLSAFSCGFKYQCTVKTGGILGLALLAGYLYWLIKNRNSLSPALAAGSAVCVTLFLTPYTWTYDQILLVIPIVAIVLDMARTGNRLFLKSLVFLLIDILMLVLLLVTARIQLEIWNGIIPLLVLILFFWQSSKGHLRTIM